MSSEAQGGRPPVSAGSTPPLQLLAHQLSLGNLHQFQLLYYSEEASQSDLLPLQVNGSPAANLGHSMPLLRGGDFDHVGFCLTLPP